MSFALQLDGRNQQMLHQMLGCLVDKKGIEQEACFVVDSEVGLCVHVVGRSKSYQSTLRLLTSCFVNVVVQGDEEVSFSVNVGKLLECLQLLGSSYDEKTASLSFDPSDAALKSTLEDHQGVFTTCDLAVFEDQMDLDHDITAAFRARPTICKLIAVSRLLRDLVADFDDGSAASKAIRLSVTERHLRLSTAGGLGTLEIDAPRALFTTFHRGKKTDIAFTYQKDIFLRGTKALSYATDTYIAINDMGMLQLRHIFNGVHFEYTCAAAHPEHHQNPLDDDPWRHTQTATFLSPEY